MPVNATRTVRELAVEIPSATRIFEQLGIDYCCGGGKSLEEACVQAGLSVDQVLRTLEQGSALSETASRELPDFRQTSLKDLIDHILAKHHVYVRQEMPRIQQLLAKVVAVHGASHSELAVTQQLFAQVSAELTSHMMKEEMVLFPYIAELESATSFGRRAPQPAFGTIKNPVRMMEMEHEEAGNAVEQIARATGQYTPPEDACFSYKTLYSALKDFALDLHQHIHLENNILFPRAVVMEEKAA
jgi:regulator of cell morphogenesis and NO signaling